MIDTIIIHTIKVIRCPIGVAKSALVQNSLRLVDFKNVTFFCCCVTEYYKLEDTVVEAKKKKTILINVAMNVCTTKVS